LKIACRVRSDVGRTRASSGATSLRPPNLPPVIRMIHLAGRAEISRRGAAMI
jgi:hypothetical protein